MLHSGRLWPIRVGWKGFPGTNTLVYYENPKITAVISFMIQARGDRKLPNNMESGKVSKFK